MIKIRARVLTATTAVKGIAAKVALEKTHQAIEATILGIAVRMTTADVLIRALRRAMHPETIEAIGRRIISHAIEIIASSAAVRMTTTGVLIRAQLRRTTPARRRAMSPEIVEAIALRAISRATEIVTHRVAVPMMTAGVLIQARLHLPARMLRLQIVRIAVEIAEIIVPGIINHVIEIAVRKMAARTDVLIPAPLHPTTLIPRHPIIRTIGLLGITHRVIAIAIHRMIVPIAIAIDVTIRAPIDQTLRLGVIVRIQIPTRVIRLTRALEMILVMTIVRRGTGLPAIVRATINLETPIVVETTTDVLAAILVTTITAEIAVGRHLGAAIVTAITGKETNTRMTTGIAATAT